MNKKLFFIASLALLLGAGCTSNVTTTPYSTTPTPVVPTSPEVQAPPPSEPVTPPAATETSPTNEKTMPKTWQFPGVLPASEITNKQVSIMTAKGEIVFKLYPEDAPKTVSNFVYLAEGGFYDGLTFHRVESWVVQGGDPTGTGRGGPGYQFEDEKVTRQYTRGIVAMANAGPNTNGSQFFILTQDTPLQPDYTIIGEVTKGMNVVDKIAAPKNFRSSRWFVVAGGFGLSPAHRRRDLRRPSGPRQRRHSDGLSAAASEHGGGTALGLRHRHGPQGHGHLS